MKRELKHGKKAVPPRTLPDPFAVARSQAQAVQAKRQQDQAAFWWALVIGSGAVIGIFTYFEAFKTLPTPRSTVAVIAQKDAPLPKPSKPIAKKPVLASLNPSPAVAEPKTVAGPAAPVAEVPAKVEPSPAERMAAEAILLTVGPESQREAALRRDQELLESAVSGKAWNAYRELLGKSIKAGLAVVPRAQGLNQFDPVWSEPVLYQDVLRWRTLGWFSESEITRTVTDEYSGGLLTWLLNDNKAMEEFLSTIHPKDAGGEVLKTLFEAWQINDKDMRKYFSLALACAVVFDHPMSIPNRISSKEHPAESVVDPIQRYLWYVRNNEKGRLAAPVHHSSARDLVWVVCAPVTTAELEWSLDKMNLRRKSWGEAYGMIQYLMERAVEGLNPYKEYSFAEILKEGGICGDQSYFCVNTARAQGIPAMTISGETDLGGHAWAGIKIEDDEWTTGVGRVGGASKGEAGNPQIGGSISEQEIHLWNDRYHQSPVVALSVKRHLWLADFFTAMEDDDDHVAAVRLANTIGHSFTETWRAWYSVLEQQTQIIGDPAVPNNLDEWKSFAKDMRREFKDNPRMAELAANAEVEYIFPYGPEGEARRTLLRERRRVERDSGEQKDLIASSLKREADLLAKGGGKEASREISQVYDRALRDYGGSITGFKMMAEDYFGFCKNEPELARKAARDIELAFKRVVETGTKDWFRAETELSIYKTICGYYRTAGDPERAEMLEKRCDVLLRRAKRGAL